MTANRTEGPFKRSLEILQSRQPRLMISAFLVVSAIIAAVTLLHRIDVYLITAIIVSGASVAFYLACYRFVRRRPEHLELKHLYLIRVSTFASSFGLLFTLFVVLHRFIAFYDNRFLIDAGKVAAAALVGLMAMLVMFIAYGRQSIQEFVRWLVAASAKDCQGVSADELDAAYGRRLTPPIGGAVSTTFALFGAFVVAKSDIFPFVVFGTELFIGFLALYAAVRLLFEICLFFLADRNIRYIRVFT